MNNQVYEKKGEDGSLIDLVRAPGSTSMVLTLVNGKNKDACALMLDAETRNALAIALTQEISLDNTNPVKPPSSQA